MSIAVSAFLLFAAIVLTITTYRVPFLGPAVGFWFLIIYPTYLLFTTNVWQAAPPLERIGYSLGSVLLILMLAGLAINEALPLLGDPRPLSPIPIAVLGDIVNVSLYILRQRRPAIEPWTPSLRTLRVPELRIITAASSAPILAILGANRLNNGAGDQIAVLTLAWIAVITTALILVRRQLRDPAIGSVIFFVALGLLLMTSLRGWVITGHDIQTEYRVFQLTDIHARWNFADFRNAYNACLSLTILPTEMARVVNVDSVYVYRFFYQMLFAVCPVLAYTFFRRYAPKGIAVLASVYFVGFPNFFGDMPFLNRQEIACIFVCCGVLLITNPYWPQRRLRVGLLAAAAGVELSHYSTMYLLFAMLAAAWLLVTAIQVARWFADHYDLAAARKPWSIARKTVGFGTLLGVAALVAIWGGLVTHTAGSVITEVGQAVSQFSSATGTPYSVLSRGTLSQQELLSQYRSAALRENSRASPGTYLPAKAVAKYPTPLVPEPNMPLTTAGRAVSSLGIPITALNTVVRQGAANGEELFIAVGFATVLLSRRLRRRAYGEWLALSAGAMATVAAFVIFPNLSTDYGSLRAFQEALIPAAPILVLGSLVLFRKLGATWTWRISAVIGMVIFTSTIGLMPQILGGYPAQLSLNNSGDDYEFFYVHPQDVSAAAWLAREPGVSPYGLQVPLGGTTATPYFYTSPAGISGQAHVEDIYPVLIQPTTWVVAGYSLLHTGVEPLPVGNEIITYKYPLDMLAAEKNLVYNNGGAEIYR